MTNEELFWDLVEPLYADPAVSRSTMMGLPCVRLEGRFFASLDWTSAPGRSWSSCPSSGSRS
jgi:hypothetical protein